MTLLDLLCITLSYYVMYSYGLTEFNSDADLLGSGTVVFSSTSLPARRKSLSILRSVTLMLLATPL